MDKLKILSGNANSELAERICAYLGVEMGKAKVSTFSDGEIQVEIEESVRGDGRLSDPAYLSAGQRQHDGAAHHDRCPETGIVPLG